MNDLISILIINWNGKKWLKECLDSLLVQTYSEYEIIVVDNASVDGSVTFIRNNYPNVKIIQSTKNLGFAAGNNLGLKHAKGNFILLLNNDTVADCDYLANFRKSFEDIPNLGAAQSKIIRMSNENKLDCCGSYWTPFTLLYHIGVNKFANLPKYNQPFPVFSNKGASMLIRRDIIDEIGLFDDDFWCYYEETDFCNRIWMSGLECWYFPSGIIRHAVGGTSEQFQNSLIQFHNFKNKLLSYLKNYEKKTLISVIPTFLILSTIFSFIWLAQGRYKNSIAIYKSFWWNFKNINHTLKKRKVIQSQRKVTDKKIFSLVSKRPKLSYFYLLVFNKLDKYEE
jgi:GT2 family glycosyltransferase